MNEQEDKIVVAIRNVIGDPKDKCYIASEALFHLLEGEYRPMVCRVGKSRRTHWYLARWDNTILDITADQFPFDLDEWYKNGRRAMWLTGYKPSRKAKEIIDAIDISSI